MIDSKLIEEEQDFPYVGLSLNEARFIRYLVSNSYYFKKYEVVSMNIEYKDNIYIINGLVYTKFNNLAFNGIINYINNCYIIKYEIEDIITHKVIKYEDVYKLDLDNILVISKMDNEVNKCSLNYPEMFDNSYIFHKN